MKRLEEFRIFYNHTIHPELLRMERKRKRLVWLVFASVPFIIFIFFLIFYINIMVITMLLIMLIALWGFYLFNKRKEFILTFKPNIVNLILDFIDDSINYGSFKYHPKKNIPKSQFLASRLFQTPAPYYVGEDFIEGKIGEVKFEMCELDVKEYSPVRNRLSYVFRGVFIHAHYHLPVYGTVLVFPRILKQYLTKTIKAFTYEGGKSVDHYITNEGFKHQFITYANGDADVNRIMPPDLQKALVNFQTKTEKELYFAYVDREIYIGITEPKDILEPNLWETNISFELVKEFFEEIQLGVGILEDFYAVQ